MTIHDSLTMDSSGTLQLQFDADPWNSLISFKPGIPIQLGGALELTFADDVDVAAQVGRTLRVFDWTGVTPSWQFLVSSPYGWDTSKLYSTGEVTLVGLPEPPALWLSLLAVASLIIPRRFARRPKPFSVLVKNQSRRIAANERTCVGATRHLS